MLWVLIRIAPARLAEAILMSTHKQGDSNEHPQGHNIGFYEDLTKIICQLSSKSNRHLIPFSDFNVHMKKAMALSYPLSTVKTGQIWRITGLVKVLGQAKIGGFVMQWPI